jgi:hypothetical protein
MIGQIRALYFDSGLIVGRSQRLYYQSLSMLSLNQKRSAALNGDCHVSGFFIPHIAGLGSEASAQESSKKNLQPLWTSRIKPLQGRRKAGHREVRTKERLELFRYCGSDLARFMSPLFLIVLK